MDDDDNQAPVAAREVERALRFIHALEMRTDVQTHETSATLYALIEELVGRGLIDLRSLEARRERTRIREAERADAEPRVLLATNVDKYALRDLPVIDCESRIPLCRARCCTLNVALSQQDLDERSLCWDYGRPYQIRRRDDGYCVHNDVAEPRRCGVYERRPAICRTYDCRHDERIWIDFDARIPRPLDPPSGR